MRCLLVDKILELQPGERIVAIKNVTMSEPFLRDHFPGFPLMPGMLQLEAVAQAASWLVYASTQRTCRARLRSLAQVTFKSFIVPGDQMRIECEAFDFQPRQCSINAGIYVGDSLKTVVKSMVLHTVAAEDLDDSLETGRFFDAISGAAPLGGYSRSGSRGL